MPECMVVTLKPGRDRSVRNRHPWIFSGAIASLSNDGAQSGPCEVMAANGEWLASGYCNPEAALAVRLHAWVPGVSRDAAWLEARLEAAHALRQTQLRAPGAPETDAYRLVYSEADGVSGLIADRFADAVSVRISSRSMLELAPAAFEWLARLPGVRRLHAAFDAESAGREGVDAVLAVRGWPTDEQPVEFSEHGARFQAHLAHGQKTGFFLDQRDNRRRAARCAPGGRVLGAYCYTGAFEIHAARAGAAEVLGVDSSEPALEQARCHAELNGVSDRVRFERADVPVRLRKFRDEGRTFDGIILDPPRFVFSAAQKEKGLRAYKDINLLALKLLAPGGWLATYSCSGLVSPEDFRQMLRWAAVDAGRPVRIIESSGQPFDHPVLATFPESEYLKGLLCRVE
ncbi:MAG: class I SAM-dependent rRNA methyltransferase [Kiritimatiellae bacterium]|nr:class I SAM-dependent rRNA methyltransferase [Kiritimatiellia bacterium]